MRIASIRINLKNAIILFLLFPLLCPPVPFDKLLIKSIGEPITKLPPDYQCLNSFANILIYSTSKKHKRNKSL